MKRARKFPPYTDRLVYATSLLVVSACGGTTKAPAAPGAASSAPSETAAPATASAAPQAPEASAATPATEPAPEAPPATPPPDAAPHGTNITYRMTANGLIAELDGLQLEPKAEPIQLGGGWGLKLVVRAKAVDGQEHQLQNPANGPLMVAAEIDRAGKKELVPDSRKGDGEMTVTADATPIERALRKPIVAGQSLTLFVGLWGVGKSGGDKKPIKKLFVVKMVAGAHKPQPVVSAPE